MTDGADAPVEGEPTDLPPPDPEEVVEPTIETDEPDETDDGVEETVVDPDEPKDEPTAETDVPDEPDVTVATDDSSDSATEPAAPLPAPEPAPVAATETATTTTPPRVGPIAVQDRRRAVLGLATAIALAAAALFGFRLVRSLTDDEVGAPSTPVEGPVGELVPFVVALAEPPASPGAPEVLAVLNSGRHDIAVDIDVGALCATVALTDEVSLAGRWERNGDVIASTEPSDLAEPGFADCVTADGEPLPDGTYQFVVTDDDAVSAPGTVVVGASAVAQRFVNETDEAVCAFRLAPMRAGYFDIFETGPIEPGGSVTLALADVRYRLEAVGCDDGDVVSRRLIRPDAVEAQSV